MKTYRVVVNVSEELMSSVFGLFHGDERAWNLKIDQTTNRPGRKAKGNTKKTRSMTGKVYHKQQVNGKDRGLNMTQAEKEKYYAWTEKHWPMFKPVFESDETVHVRDSRLQALMLNLGLSHRSLNSMIIGFQTYGHVEKCGTRGQGLYHLKG